MYETFSEREKKAISLEGAVHRLRELGTSEIYSQFCQESSLIIWAPVHVIPCYKPYFSSSNNNICHTAKFFDISTVINMYFEKERKGEVL